MNVRDIGELKHMLRDLKSDLQEHIEKLKEMQETTEPKGADREERKDLECDRETISEELESANIGIMLCARASRSVERIRLNVYETVTAEEDAHQSIMSEPGSLIFAKKVTAAARATQWMGQYSTESVLELTKFRGLEVSARDLKNHCEKQTKGNLEFVELYGTGHTLCR